MVRHWLLPFIAAGMAVYTAIYVFNAHPVASSLTFPGEPPIAPFVGAIAASGILEAESENMMVASPVPGNVSDVFVVEHQVVEIGDQLLRLDDRRLRAELNVREAAVRSAREQLARLDSLPRLEELPAKEAAVREFQALLDHRAQQLNRMRELRSRQAITEAEFESAEQMFQVAEAQLATTQADYSLLKAGAWEPDRALARAELAAAEAERDLVECDLERLTVRSLIRGTVLQINIHPGEYAGAPATQPLMILGALDKLHVRVDIDDRDIPRFRTDANATAVLRGSARSQVKLHFVRVDAIVIPKQELSGAISEQIDTRVLQAIYQLDATDIPLYVGQQLDVFIEVAE